MTELIREWAKRFHNEYERLAPEYRYETREETKQFDPDTPNGRLMMAVIDSLGVAQLEMDVEEYVKVGASLAIKLTRRDDKIALLLTVAKAAKMLLNYGESELYDDLEAALAAVEDLL